MIFDTIYNFFQQLLSSNDAFSFFWENGFSTYYMGEEIAILWADYFSSLGTVIVIALGVVALFRILGGVLRLFKV